MADYQVTESNTDYIFTFVNDTNNLIVTVNKSSMIITVDNGMSKKILSFDNIVLIYKSLQESSFGMDVLHILLLIALFRFDETHFRKFIGVLRNGSLSEIKKILPQDFKNILFNITGVKFVKRVQKKQKDVDDTVTV